jgi:molecular chaperone HscB
MKDPFEILGVERRFNVDLRLLEKAHRELSRVVHPDKYAQTGAAERHAAAQSAATINEAVRALRDPIRRAEALFRIHGVLVGEEHEPKSSPAFLMEVLEDREELALAKANKDLARAQAIKESVGARLLAVESKLDQGFVGPTTPESLRALLPLLGALRFYRRLLDEVNAIEEDAA